MCGIVGIVSNESVSYELCNALTILQHRGQDAAGIMTGDAKRIHLQKGNGFVRDVLNEDNLSGLAGNFGLGHVRYRTAGTDSAHESQPFYVNSPYGLGLVHNGNIVNSAELRSDLIKDDFRHLNTESDSEIILNVFAYELQNIINKKFSIGAIFSAVKKTMARIQGAYACIVLIHGYGLLAFRDPHGVRPLVYGCRKGTEDKADEFMVASESIALDALGYDLIDDVVPGQAVFFGVDGSIEKKQCHDTSSLTPCLFEYLYLSRPDSIIDNIPVYQARINLGKKLADKIKAQFSDYEIDAVIPVPDTGRTIALPLALRLGSRYSEGFVKNRYIPRTFIMAKQSMRRDAIRLKLNAIRQEFDGKNVLLVDDSIVRGNTSKEIIRMARECGAKKVYFASAAPKVRFSNVYGIDIPNVKNLIAHNKTTAEIASELNSDGIIFLSVDEASDAVLSASLSGGDQPKSFESSIFTGEYLAESTLCEEAPNS